MHNERSFAVQPPLLPSRPVALLALADGTLFEGFSIGAAGETVGEVVFNTALTGYQEILTDPSYAQQIVTLTYPHIGNYGVNAEDVEARKVYAAGLVIKELPVLESNFRRSLTRRSDVAFWLHLLAAPMIVHPVFTLLGLNDGTATIGEGLVVILLYVVIGAHRAGDRPPRAARLRAGLRALRAQPAVRAVRRGRAQRCADRAGDRLGAADAVGLLAPGPRHGRPAAAGRSARSPAADRPGGAYSSTSRMSRRSSGARMP